MTTRRSKTTTGNVSTAKRGLTASAYSYYGGTIRATGDSGQSAGGVKRMFAASMLSGASMMAVLLAGSGSATALPATGACLPQAGPGSQILCSGVFNETIVIDVDDVTVTLGDGSTVNTLGGYATEYGGNAGIVVTGDDATVINRGTVLTGYGSNDYESDIYFDGHHGIAVYANEGDATVENTATGIIGTVADRSFGIYAVSDWDSPYNQTDVVNAGSISTTGDGSHAISAEGKYVDVSNTGLIFTGGDDAHGIYASAKYDTYVFNSGEIETEGDDSDGIHAVSNGFFADSGDIEVVIAESGIITTSGESAFGVSVSADDYGSVRNAGTIVTTGDDATGVYLDGDTVYLNNTGSIKTYGEDAEAVDARSGSRPTTTIINSGTIYAYGESSGGVEASGPTVVVKNLETGFIGSESDVAVDVDDTDDGRVYNYGEIVGSVDVYAADYAYLLNDGDIDANGESGTLVEVRSANGNAIVVNGETGRVQTAESYSVAISAYAPEGYAAVRNHGEVITGYVNEVANYGDYSTAISVFAEDGALALNTGDIDTYGIESLGLSATSEYGVAQALNTGDIDTSGDRALGVYAHATGEEYVYEDYSYSYEAADALAGNAGTITTQGDDAIGVVALSGYGAALAYNVLDGSISTSGDGAHGIFAGAGFNDLGDALDFENGTGNGESAVAINGIPTFYGGGFFGDVGEGFVSVSDFIDTEELDPTDFRSTVVTTGDGAVGVLAHADNGGALAANFYGTVTTGTRDEYGALSGEGAYGIAAFAEDGDALAWNKYHADIVTNGDGAHGMVASSGDGDARAFNKYASSVVTHGDGSYGIRVYASGSDEDGYDAIAYNGGSSVTTYGDGAIGIDVSSEYGDAEIANGNMTIGEGEEEEVLTGRIETYGDNAIGVRAVADLGQAEVYNNGDIITHGDAAYGVLVEGETVHVYNRGNIKTYGDGAHAVIANSSFVDTTIIENDGLISATGKYADAIIASGPTVRITNEETGEIYSADGDAIYVSASNDVSIYNYGTVTGDIVVSTGEYSDTYILHTGTLTGDIDISEGGSSDTIIVDGGTITGAIFTGDGTDDVTVQGEGVEITKGIHAGDEGSAELTFAQTDTITFSDGIDGYAVSNFDTVLFSSGTTIFDGVGIHTDEGSVSVSGDATLATTADGAYIVADNLEVDGTLSIARGGWFDVSGSVDFNEGSTFRTGLSSDGAGVIYGDTIFFSDGSTIYTDVTGGLAGVVGDDFLIASANSEGGVTDEGAAVEDNTILYRFRKVMDGEIVTSGSADDLFLRIEIDETALETETDALGGANLKQIAAAIDKYLVTQPIDSPLVLFLSQYETNEEQRAALLEVIRDTLPDEVNSTGETTIASTDLIFDMIMDRLSGGGFTVADNGSDTGLSAGDTPLGGAGKWALWGRIGASTAEYTPSGVNGFDADTWGGTIGIDGEVAPNTRLGLGVFYTESSIDENGTAANSSNDIDGTGAVAYMSYRPGAWYLNASLGYGMNSYDSQRRSVGGVNIADYDGTQFVARAEVGYMFVSGQWDLTPNVGLRYNLVDVDSYTETGPLPISVDSQTTESLRAVAGVNVRYTMALEGGGRLIPEFGVKILTELADPNEALTGAVVGGGAFTTQTTPRDDVSYGVGGGLTYEASDRVTFRVTYDSEFQSDYTEQTLAAAIRFAF